MKEIKVRDMVDGLQILVGNRTKKPVAITLSGAGRGRDGRGYLINVQYEPIWNCDNEYPLYNKYILIYFFFKRGGGEREREKMGI
jgi:hypothetical protein